MKNENISKLKALLMGICLLLVVALIVFLFVIERNNNPKTNNKDDKDVKYEKYTSYDGLFSIEVPNTWKEVETKNSLNEKAVLELEKEDDNAYLVVVVNNKKDLNETFAQFKTNVFKQKEAVYKKTISKYVDVVIDERTAQYGVIYYTKDNVNTYNINKDSQISNSYINLENVYMLPICGHVEVAKLTMSSYREIVKSYIEFHKITDLDNLPNEQKLILCR